MVAIAVRFCNILFLAELYLLICFKLLLFYISSGMYSYNQASKFPGVIIEIDPYFLKCNIKVRRYFWKQIIITRKIYTEKENR